jgi:hypothetical protein
MDNLAHKMVDTFEKMDAINPTFEQIQMDDGQHKII